MKKFLIIFVMVFLSIFLIENTLFAEQNQELTPAEKLHRENLKYKSLEAYSTVLDLLENQYVDMRSVQPSDLIEKSLEKMASGLDPHTLYLTPAQFRKFSANTSGRFAGIGVIISQKKGYLEIVDIVADSPAENSPLKKGYVITSVDGVSINKDNISEVVENIKGEIGTEVVIKYKKNLLDKKQFKLTLTRKVIRTNSISFSPLSEHEVYLGLKIFQENSYQQMTQKIRQYERKHGPITGMVFDLRSNPGGLFDQATKIANLFINHGILVSTVGRNKSGPDRVAYASRRNALHSFQMVTLVNGGSASASEIVAGALQDSGRSLILGSRTFGKGSVQNIVPLANGGAIKFTIARYYTPKGRSIQALGITPDIPLLSQAEYLKAKAQRENVYSEANLEHHIISLDVDSQLQKEKSYIQKWPKNLKDDYQIVMSYSILKKLSTR